ncbi:MAG: xylose isomerase [Deltaproteobacteria bacterium HGW-Deltaproteobacteria-6]|jgi:sugar phosphate isomerase/epimerase|nr:MAG: xylose isomerase [Deltaproteobacteria bacterium HGW-Deltaproteobacteria-6]
MNSYPFRLGTTSYIIPADILPNVRYLAGKVRDVELVLFEVDDGPNNLPAREQIAELKSIARDHDLTYTVHLPLDLRLADDGSPRHASIEKARRVIDCTRELDPWAYVLHLDGRSVRHSAAPERRFRWQQQAAQSLAIVGEWAGGLQKLAVENLEGYPPDFYQPVLQRIAVSRTVDVGHLWLDGYDPVVYLREALPRTRVIHIHGIDGSDHKSLAQVPAESLRAVLDELVRFDYRGVLTIEVFSENDFITSLAAVEAMMKGKQ